MAIVPVLLGIAGALLTASTRAGASLAIVDSEWAALVDLYSATNGSQGWLTNTGWSDLIVNKSCITAYGVYCDYGNPSHVT